MSVEQCMLEAFDDLDISHRCLDDNEKFFADVIGCIEDILMRDDFLKLHTNFMEEYWQQFDDSEENKLEYIDIFEKYNETIEKYIETELVKAVPEFNMPRFEMEMRSREGELNGEIFEILATFSDFLSFKEKFLDYKAMKLGSISDPSQALSVSKCEFENA